MRYPFPSVDAWLLLAVLLTGGAAACGQQPYTVVEEGVQPYASIATGGNLLFVVSVCDECIQQVQLPFAFPWFGERLTQLVSVTSNGQINMDGRVDPECCDAARIPDAGDNNHDAIFIAKQDLFPRMPGGLYALTLGSPPNRTWTCELQQVPFFPLEGRVDAQVTLSEADGSITLHFAPTGDLAIDGATGMPNRFSAGVESRDGRVGSPASAGSFFDAQGICSTTWPAGHRIRFAPPTLPDLRILAIRPSAVTADPGALISVEVDLVKYGTGPLTGVAVDLFMNPAVLPVPGDTGTWATTVDFGPEPGATATARFVGLTSPVPTTWELAAIVDTTTSVPETDELNNVLGPQRLFWVAAEPLPFCDGFDAGLRWVIDPPNPAGGSMAPCAGSVPCEHARAVIDPARQGACAPGTAALVLDSDSANDWLGLAALPVADDPERWDEPSPAGMPSHVGELIASFDTASAATLALSFAYSFLVDEPHHQQFVVEVDDGRGWRRVAGAGASAGLAGDIYRPACAVPGGCGGAPAPWNCENIDLSSVAAGGEVRLRFRWLVRNGVASFDPTAVLLDDVCVSGDPTGLRGRVELIPQVVELDEPGLETLAIAFRIDSVGEAHTVDAVHLSASGTLDDGADISVVNLYEDIDGSRTLTPADTFLVSGSFAVDDGTIVMPTARSLVAGATWRLLATTQLDVGAPSSADVTLTLSAIEGRDSGGSPPAIGGLPTSGDRLVVSPPRLRLATGSGTPPQPVVRTPGETDVVVAQWRLEAGGSPGAFRGLTLRGDGDGNDLVGLANLRLVREFPSTANGRLDPGELAVATAPAFSRDDGTAVLALAFPFDLVHGDVEHLLYVVDITPAAASGGMTHRFDALLDGPGSIDADAAEVTLPIAWQPAQLRVTDGCPLSRCGDCNVDGVVDVIDALFAAQHAVGLISLQANPFANCNVAGLIAPDPGAVVDITDALKIAQAAAGLGVTLTCC